MVWKYCLDLVDSTSIFTKRLMIAKNLPRPDQFNICFEVLFALKVFFLFVGHCPSTQLSFLLSNSMEISNALVTQI